MPTASKEIAHHFASAKLESALSEGEAANYHTVVIGAYAGFIAVWANLRDELARGTNFDVAKWTILSILIYAAWEIGFSNFKNHPKANLIFSPKVHPWVLGLCALFASFAIWALFHGPQAS